jgi:hypothetical protein
MPSPKTNGDGKVKYLLATATVLVSIGTANASYQFNVGCTGFKTVPTERSDDDPVIRTMIDVLYPTHSDGIASIEVTHETLKGETYVRSEQYRDLRFWSGRKSNVWGVRKNNFWSGVSAKNPRMMMIGELVAQKYYTEKTFIGGKLARTTTSTCTLLPEGDLEK